MTKYTPGPWGYEADTLRGAKIPAPSFIVVTPDPDGEHKQVVGRIYNEKAARLIAAAPDMLKALEAVAAWFEDDKADDSAWCLVHDAIAKAAGGPR